MISISSQPYPSLQSTTSSGTPTSTTTEAARFADQLQELSQPTTPTPTTNAVVPGPTTPDLTTSSSSASHDTADNTGVSAAVKNFIEWQGAQPNPFGQGTIADVWAKQGITAPLSNPVLIAQAETQLNRAEQRSAMNPNYVAEWKGDWKTQMAEAKAAENQRQTFLAAADALGKVTVGGGIASMVG